MGGGSEEIEYTFTKHNILSGIDILSSIINYSKKDKVFINNVLHDIDLSDTNLFFLCMKYTDITIISDKKSLTLQGLYVGLNHRLMLHNLNNKGFKDNKTNLYYYKGQVKTDSYLLD